MTVDSEIRIIPVRPEDHDAWLPLWRSYQSFYEVDIPLDVSATTWARLNDPAESVAGALAWTGLKPSAWFITSGTGRAGPLATIAISGIFSSRPDAAAAVSAASSSSTFMP